MPIILPHFKCAFFSVPKIASTSLKNSIFEINNGFKFASIAQRMKQNGRKNSGTPHFGIHQIYITGVFNIDEFKHYRNFVKFTVIRDPLERLLSAYSNKVIFYKALEQPRVAQQLEYKGLDTNPDLNGFVLNINHYRQYSLPIRHHTEPISSFLGDRLNRFHRVFKIEKMENVVEFLSQSLGTVIDIPIMQTGGPKFSVSDLDKKALKAATHFCALDYQLVRDYYEPPVLRK